MHKVSAPKYRFRELPHQVQYEIVQKLLKKMRKIEKVNDYIVAHDREMTQAEWLEMGGK